MMHGQANIKLIYIYIYIYKYIATCYDEITCASRMKELLLSYLYNSKKKAQEFPVNIFRL